MSVIFLKPKEVVDFLKREYPIVQTAHKIFSFVVYKICDSHVMRNLQRYLLLQPLSIISIDPCLTVSLMK